MKESIAKKRVCPFVDRHCQATQCMGWVDTPTQEVICGNCNHRGWVVLKQGAICNKCKSPNVSIVDEWSGYCGAALK